MGESGFTLVDAKGCKCLTGEEHARLLAAARSHPRPAVQTFALILAHTGCRISEALALRAQDVDLEAAELRFRTLKCRREHWRTVPVPEDLVRELELVHRLRRGPGLAEDGCSPELRIATLKRRRAHWRAVPVPGDLVEALELVHRVRRAQASPRGRNALL